MTDRDSLLAIGQHSRTMLGEPNGEAQSLLRSHKPHNDSHLPAWDNVYAPVDIGQGGFDLASLESPAGTVRSSPQGSVLPHSLSRLNSTWIPTFPTGWDLCSIIIEPTLDRAMMEIALLSMTFLTESPRLHLPFALASGWRVAGVGKGHRPKLCPGFFRNDEGVVIRLVPPWIIV